MLFWYAHAIIFHTGFGYWIYTYICVSMCVLSFSDVTWIHMESLDSEWPQLVIYNCTAFNTNRNQIDEKKSLSSFVRVPHSLYPLAHTYFITAVSRPLFLIYISFSSVFFSHLRLFRLYLLAADNAWASRFENDFATHELIVMPRRMMQSSRTRYYLHKRKQTDLQTREKNIHTHTYLYIHICVLNRLKKASECGFFNTSYHWMILEQPSASLSTLQPPSSSSSSAESSSLLPLPSPSPPTSAKLFSFGVEFFERLNINMNSEITLVKPQQSNSGTNSTPEWNIYDLYDVWWDEDLFV